MRHPEIRQRVVVHRHPAAQPAIGEVLLAQPGELPRAADPVHRRPQPQRHHQLGRRRRLPRHPLPRLHRIMQRAQIKRLHKRPHRPHRMIARHQIVDHRHLPAQLMPLRLPQPRHPPTRRFRHTLLRQIPKKLALVRHQPAPPQTTPRCDAITPFPLAGTPSAGQNAQKIHTL